MRQSSRKRVNALRQLMESLEPRLLRTIDLSFSVLPLTLLNSGYSAFSTYETELEAYESQASPPTHAGPPVAQTTSGLSELNYYPVSPSATPQDPKVYDSDGGGIDATSPVVSDALFNYNFNGDSYPYAQEPYVPGIYFDGSSLTVNAAITNSGNTAIPVTALPTGTATYPHGNIYGYTATGATPTNEVRVDFFLSPTPSITMEASNGGSNQPDGYSVPDTEYFLGTVDVGTGFLPGQTRYITTTLPNTLNVTDLVPTEPYYLVVKVDPLGEAVDLNGYGEQNVSNNTWVSPYADIIVDYSPAETDYALPPSVSNPQDYVDYLYTDVLDRGSNFDPVWTYTPHFGGTPSAPTVIYSIAESQDLSDLTSFSDPITFGQSTATGTLTTFEATPEYAYVTINNAYETVFNRSVDITGLTYFTSVLHASSAPNVMQQLVGSDEFYQDSGGTNALYVSALYEVLLDRQVDPTGLGYWQAQLNAGESRLYVAESISNSFEGRDLLVNQTYEQLLGRAAAANEQAYWANFLTSGNSYQSLIYNITFSNELYDVLIAPYPGE